MSRLAGRINPATTQFLVCDIQERFREAIVGFPQLIENSKKLLETSKLLSIPTIVTEQVRRDQPQSAIVLMALFRIQKVI